MKRVPTIVFLLLLCYPASVRAIGVAGLVTKIHDGKSLAVTNANRNLEVLLEGLDIPEQGQEFADVARQHLADLVLGKAVYVRYTGIQPSGRLIAKVYLNDMDVGLQVIRDGVAWYDRGANGTLTDAERGIYADSEQAARDERRGMWQYGSPMPPWEWRRAQATKTNAAYRTAQEKTGKNRKGLRTEDLLFARSRNVPGRGKAGAREKPNQKPLNTPGEDCDFQSYLQDGRISVVYFYADWCPACQGLSPTMDMINNKFANMQVLFMNIGNWNTPVARKYAVSFVPYLKIYDEKGQLIVEGPAARGWLDRTIQERNQRGR